MGENPLHNLARNGSATFARPSLCFLLQIRYLVLINCALNVINNAGRYYIGNLANDGFRLGRRLDLVLDLDLPRPNSSSARTQDPLFRSGSACAAAWRHCPPLGPSVHAISTLCSLVAKLVLEARLIKDGLISRGNFALINILLL